MIVTTHEFNRLRKINFDARMKQEAKSLGSKNQVDTALDIVHKKEKKFKKIKSLLVKVNWWWWTTKVFNISTIFKFFYKT